MTEREPDDDDTLLDDPETIDEDEDEDEDLTDLEDDPAYDPELKRIKGG
jgi:hypothetical protein